MPVCHHLPSEPDQQRGGQHHDAEAIHCAYRMIGQLRRLTPGKSSVTALPRATPDQPAVVRDARPIRPIGRLVTQNA